VKALQQKLGFGLSGQDGQWGPVTSAAARQHLNLGTLFGGNT
jgi:hypothetical protein